MKARMHWALMASAWLAAGVVPAASEDGVFVRFRLQKPEDARYYVRLGGFLHVPSWILPMAEIPTGAGKEAGPRLAAGEFTAWFDLAAHAGGKLHRRHHRAGGIAEFPNVTARFVTVPEAPRRDVEIELAVAPDAAIPRPRRPWFREHGRTVALAERGLHPPRAFHPPGRGRHHRPGATITEAAMVNDHHGHELLDRRQPTTYERTGN